MISSLIGAVHHQTHLYILLNTDIQGAKLYFAHKGLNYRLAYRNHIQIIEEYIQ